ncbi:MAG TPA: hypothetical protein DCE14_00375 [Kosmotogaceae bacterium]|nr:MAG: Uncharacterized protein XE05_0057 [Thermotogales bacterium 46_20]HAA84802.1 hypothetical protein [Kosmotogaceae bacterium]
MERRANFALFLLSLLCAWCVLSFAAEALFSDPVDVRVSIISDQRRTVRFPSVMSVSGSPVIIVPATTEPVGGDRFIVKSAEFVAYFENSHYWVSDDLVITDFVKRVELREVPVISGVDFKLEQGEFRVIANEEVELLAHVKRLLSDGRIWSIVAHVDLFDGYLLLKRGIKITVYDWDKLSRSTDALYNLSLTAMDKTEYLFLGEGKLLRVR